MTNSSNEAPWRVSVKLNGTDRGTSFKIDTGADVSVMSLQTYNNMSPKPPLQKTAAVLRSPTGTLDCKGSNARVKGVDYPLRIDLRRELRIYVVSSGSTSWAQQLSVSSAGRQQQEWGSSAVLTLLKNQKRQFSVRWMKILWNVHLWKSDSKMTANHTACRQQEECQFLFYRRWKMNC